jgi:hypothetical protein
MKTYYKNSNQATSFNKENGELVNIFKVDSSFTFGLQVIQSDQRDLMVSKLDMNNQSSTKEEFDVILTEFKNKVDTI